MKPFIIIACILFCVNTIYAQNHDEVVDYIENKKYTNKPRAEVYVDVNNFDIKGGFLEDLETGLLYGVKNTHITNDPQIIYLDQSRNPNSGSLSSLLATGPHYLISCTISDFEFVDNEKKNGGTYELQAIIKGIDVVTGTVEFYRLLSMQGKSKEVKQVTMNYQSSDMSKAMAKKIRETTRDLMKSNFPVVNWVLEIEEVKKDKAKVISVEKLRHMTQSNPKQVNAFIVDQEIEINGTKHFTFLKIGEAKKPFMDKKAMNKTFFNVNKGEKEILSAFNEGKKVYLTVLELGDK